MEGINKEKSVYKLKMKKTPIITKRNKAEN